MSNLPPENPAETGEARPCDDAPRLEEPVVEVIILAPRTEPQAHIRSPRLVHPEQAAFFVKQMILE